MYGVSAIASRVRLLIGRQLARAGFRQDTFLLLLAVAVGVVTAMAAVAFHSLINYTRDLLYKDAGPRVQLYGRGVWLLAVIPAAGGLVVGLLSRYVFRTREGHGIVDVMESVTRSSGFIRPLTAIEKILTAGVTIGTGGSAGAEGPIVQIGAGVASGIGQLFRVTRQHMPLLIGCGTAAGISAIFNSPIGGVLFTLEVILLDFSIRTFTPVVLASVVANVATKVTFQRVLHERFEAIFALDLEKLRFLQPDIDWRHVPLYVLLGAVCGVVGVCLTRTMYFGEHHLSFKRLPKSVRPALGGAIVGLLGVAYVTGFGWHVLHTAKPFAFADYPLPAFFGDGYGVIRQLFSPEFYEHAPYPVILLLMLCGLKIVATCLTLNSGGSGGIIAPSLFLGATAGGALGLLLQRAGLMGAGLRPEICAIVGMGAVLAAVVHAPLASILILSDLTHDYAIVLPGMLTTIIATGVARTLFRDSIYTLTLRARGVRVGGAADVSLLKRLLVEQVPLEPTAVVRGDDPFEAVLQIVRERGVGDFVVEDGHGIYDGMVTEDGIQHALIDREAVPLLLVRDVMRRDVPMVRSNDDLSTVLDTFSLHEAETLPVCLPTSPGRVIGLISRVGLMRRYQEMLKE